MKNHSMKEAFQIAIQMEKDGHAFYTKAATCTTDEYGRAMFESLAADELVHLETFQKLFHGKIDAVEWQALVQTSNKYADLPVFPRNPATTGDLSPKSNELDALRIGMDSEQEAIEYYTTIFNETGESEVKEILTEIINQEKNHYRLLQQEFSHLSSTGLWYNPDPRGA